MDLRAGRDDVERRPDVESYLAEDEALVAARERAGGLGCAAVSPAAGALLRFLAATIGARAVVEVGTGAGVSGLWLLQGMAADGVLTSIDVEPEHQRAARAAFIGAGYGPSRLRLINGMALEVLPRLTDAGYDLVVVDAVAAEYPRYLEEAVRLLRTGGVVVLHRALDEVADLVRADERLVPVLLPLGDGLLCAARR